LIVFYIGYNAFSHCSFWVLPQLLRKKYSTFCHLTYSRKCYYLLILIVSLGVLLKYVREKNYIIRCLFYSKKYYYLLLLIASRPPYATTLFHNKFVKKYFIIRHLFYLGKKYYYHMLLLGSVSSYGCTLLFDSTFIREKCYCPCPMINLREY
jgi:hypothetical protein